MKCFFSILALISLNAFAASPSQPERESTDDLRVGLVMFSIDSKVDERIVWLEKTPSDDYFLRMTKGKTEKIIKLSSKEAKQIDMEFASKFLKTMYELPNSPEKCKIAFQLLMKGEGQSICKEEDGKTREFIPFEATLYKRF